MPQMNDRLYRASTEFSRHGLAMLVGMKHVTSLTVTSEIELTKMRDRRPFGGAGAIQVRFANFIPRG
jgi:hypothetical protein